MGVRRFVHIGFVLLTGLAFAPRLLGQADPGLVAWWKLDEGSGGVASDSSGNANAGSVVGAEWETGVMAVSVTPDPSGGRGRSGDTVGASGGSVQVRR